MGDLNNNALSAGTEQGAKHFTDSYIDTSTQSFSYSRGKRKTDNNPEQRVAKSFDEFLQSVWDDKSAEKGSSYICAPMIEGLHNATDKYPGLGTWRLMHLCGRRQWQPLDVDYLADNDALQSLLAICSEWRCMVYTTASHTEDNPRVRVIIQTDREMKRDEGIAVGEAVESELTFWLNDQIKLDPTVFRGEQPCYLPTVGAQRWLFDGEPLRVDDLLAKPKANKPTGEYVPISLEDFEQVDHAGFIKRGEDVHTHAAKLVGKLVASGTADHVIRSYMGELAGALANERGEERASALMGDELDRLIAGARAKGYAPGASSPIPTLEAISLSELESANTHPRIILDGFLYADVRVRVAAGGVGKTTLALYEAATLALGRELWGRKPDAPRRTVLVTREDSRELLVGRLAQVLKAMQLDKAETLEVLQRVSILDLTEANTRLSIVAGDVVVPHRDNIDTLAERLEAFNPDWVIFDPLISFGVGESRVNDSEQGLIEAFRLLRNRLNACIEGIHHTGKANARSGASDQYASRGGTALPDGSRMMAIINRPENDALDKWIAMTDYRPQGEEVPLIMTLPKLSYSKPQPPICIKRNGFGFEWLPCKHVNPHEADHTLLTEVYTFVADKYAAGEHYSRTNMELLHDMIGLRRTPMRNAIAKLIAKGCLSVVGGKGLRGTHLKPENPPELKNEGNFEGIFDE